MQNISGELPCKPDKNSRDIGINRIFYRKNFELKRVIGYKIIRNRGLL